VWTRTFLSLQAGRQESVVLVPAGLGSPIRVGHPTGRGGEADRLRLLPYLLSGNFQANNTPPLLVKTYCR